MDMHRSRTACALLATALLGVAATAAPAKDAGGFVRLRPDEIQWRDEPGYGGLKIAVLAGDPSKAGLYVIRVKFPPGLMTRPHRHPEDRHAIVVSGTWYTGEGQTFDPARTVPLKPGSYMKHPADAYHYDGAKDEEVVVQIAGYGPSATVFSDPAQGATGSSVEHH